jgi:hypothetical protein
MRRSCSDQRLLHRITVNIKSEHCDQFGLIITVMSRLYRIFSLIVYLGVLNFMTFAVIGLLLGGDGLSGKVEAGHYYLGNHGVYTEMPGIIYWYSRVHGISVFVSWPFVMLAGLATSFGGPYDGKVIHLGKVYGLVEEWGWRLFDSWRKPNVEFFTRMTGEEWNSIFELALRQYNTERSWPRHTNICTGGNHFDIGDSRSLTEVHGRVTATAHGVYVRIWHRFAPVWLLFLTVFGVFFTHTLMVLSVWLLAALALQRDLPATYETIRPMIGAQPVLAITVVGTILGLIWLGAHIGERINRDKAQLIKDALTNKYYLAGRVASIYRR